MSMPSEPSGPTPGGSNRRPGLGSGDRVGPYRLLDLVGEGSMGEVWRAEQIEPIRRIVALKLIRRGLESAEVLTRFENERRSMARFDHPWIPRILDAGEAPDGRPFIVMEFVDGEPITDFCRERGLGIEDRLRLMQKVCRAVQHAHQNAVIHRDLKPGNILVVEIDGEPIPRIIDFGVAKSTSESLTEGTVATFLGQLIGTPMYMSPEQLALSDTPIDTRSDVYALGVVLYELLVGELPFDSDRVAQMAVVQVVHYLVHEPLPRPSARLSTLGARRDRGTSSAQTWRDVGRLRGDLDWIVLKALEKDRERRYATPIHLAEDIERHLRSESIDARRPSTFDIVRRFSRRHRSAVSTGVMVVVALAVFSIWQTVQSSVIARQRDRARANERLALARGQLDQDPTLAIAYALSSLDLVDQETTRDVIREAVSRGPLRDELPRADAPGNPLSLDASFDGTRLAVAWAEAAEAPLVRIHDLRHGTVNDLVGPGPGFAFEVKFSSDARYVVAVAMNGLHVWRVADGRHVMHAFEGLRSGTISVFPIEGGELMALAVSRRGEATAWYHLDLDRAELHFRGHSRSRTAADIDIHVPAIDFAGEWVLDFEDGVLYRQRFGELDTDRWVRVGSHDTPIESVAIDRTGTFAASVDTDGHVLVWNLTLDPPRLTRRFRVSSQGPGNTRLEFDPYRKRFAALSMAPHMELFDLSTRPPGKSVLLRDRSHWTHDAAFFPDGSLMTSRNGLPVGPIAHWRTPDVRNWSIDLGDSLGYPGLIEPSSDGSAVFAWTERGAIVRIAIGSGPEPPMTILGRTNMFNPGMASRFYVSRDDKRFLTYNSGEHGAWLLDVEDGSRREIRPFEEDHRVRALSPRGRRAVIGEFPEGAVSHRRQYAIDLDDLRILYSWSEVRNRPSGVTFVTEDSLLVCQEGSVAFLDLGRSEAAFDTVWYDPDRIVMPMQWSSVCVAVSADGAMQRIDARNGSTGVIEATHRPPYAAFEYAEAAGLIARTGLRGGLEVIDVREGRRWKVPLAATGSVLWKVPLAATGSVLAIAPDGRWVVATDSNGLHCWMLPFDGIHERERAVDFLERAAHSTNVRVVERVDEPGVFDVTNLAESPR